MESASETAPGCYLQSGARKIPNKYLYCNRYAKAGAIARMRV